MQRQNDPKLAAPLPNTLRFLDEPILIEMGLAKSVHTLRTWRAQNRGPKFIKVGTRVKYRLSDIEDFLSSQPHGGGTMRVIA